MNCGFEECFARNTDNGLTAIVQIQFRSARRRSKASGSMFGDFGANKNRMEKMRIAMGLEKVPVLRNRKRALVFFESPFDTCKPRPLPKL